MKKILVLLLVFMTVFTSCSNHVKILVKNISMGGTGDNYVVSPAKVEVNLNKQVSIPITITNKNDRLGTFELKIISPEQLTSGYESYPVNGLWVTMNEDVIDIPANSSKVVNLYIGKVQSISDTQLWVSIHIQTNQQITSAYMVNVLIKGDKK